MVFFLSATEHSLWNTPKRSSMVDSCGNPAISVASQGHSSYQVSMEPRF